MNWADELPASAEWFFLICASQPTKRTSGECGRLDWSRLRSLCFEDLYLHCLSGLLKLSFQPEISFFPGPSDILIAILGVLGSRDSRCPRL